MRRSTQAVSLWLVASGVAAQGAYGAKPTARCEDGQTLVQQGEVAYAGPGFGHAVRYRFDRTRCVKVLRRSSDGGFLLVESAGETALWVADPADPSEQGAAASEEAVPFDPSFVVVVTQDAALYRAPKLRASAITTLEPATTLTVLGASADGQWWYGDAQGQRGWVPKAHTAAELPAAGQTPSAGSRPWRAPALDETAPAPPVAATDDGEPLVVVEGGAAANEQLIEEPASEMTSLAVSLDAPPRARRPHLTVALGASTWNQRYLSDAQNDPYHRYALSSTGGHLHVGYGWRGDLPLVVDVRATVGGYGFDFAAAGPAPPSYGPVGWVELSTLVGARLYGDPWVDVEAGLDLGATAVWITDLIVDGVVVPAFTPGVYLDAIRPTVRAVSRLDEGRQGVISFEASLPAGFYLMVYDPALLPEEISGVKDQLRLDDTNAVAIGEQSAEAPYVHPFVGVTVSGSYGFDLGDTLHLSLAGHGGVRQAFIAGPGRRVSPDTDADPSMAWDGIYTEASNVDLFAGISLGGRFSL
ncbi:MAG: hypothetical protein ACO3JL_18115 [Myxococcota bacterium]